MRTPLKRCAVHLSDVIVNHSGGGGGGGERLLLRLLLSAKKNAPPPLRKTQSENTSAKHVTLLSGTCKVNAEIL